ncbi:MAG: hypothetical protein QOK20_924, partial [Acidimicrobiaceae bacterium]|jgi:hypothetical protein|nr:hypothetical protein [Acidimicrobiaceae bacterium]
LIPLQASLEEAFMNITRETVEFATSNGRLGEPVGAEGVLR